MEGTLAPRGASAVVFRGFRETAGGGSLGFGRPRYTAGALVVGATFLALAPAMAYVSSVAAANGNSGGALGFEANALLFALLGALVVAVAVLQGGQWVLSADENAVRLQRGHRRERVIPWADVKRIRVGPTAIAMGRRGAQLGDAIRVDAQHVIVPVSVDTVRFKVSADDVDRMAAVLKDIGQRHGVPVEPFPMAGRGGA